MEKSSKYKTNLNGDIIETQPVPNGFNGIKSIKIINENNKNKNKIITLLSNNGQFIYSPYKSCFDLITDHNGYIICHRTYILI